MVRLSVVATLYHSAAFLPEFHARVTEAARALTPDYEIVLVNDGSPDGSLDLAVGIHERDPRVRVVDLSRNFGHHRAMMTGLAHARGELVFLIDSDLEEDPGLLGAFHREMGRRGADVVYGVQASRKGGVFERVSGWLFFTVFNHLAPVPMPPNLCTVRLMTRRYVTALVAHQERQFTIGGLWAITGFEQVPMTIDKRSREGTTYSLARKVLVLVDSVTSFSDRPLIAAFYAGLVIVLGASAAAAYLVVRRVFFGVLLAGWPSLIVSVWLLGGLNLFCLGLIGIYLSKVFIETKQRPYVIVRRLYEQGNGSRERG
jgi:putative glycosyltransferase